MKIGFDFDGVISYLPLSRAILSIGKSFHSAQKSAVKKAKPYPEAIQLIKELEAAGHDITIITGRPDETVREETEEALAKYGLSHLTKKLIMNPKNKFDDKWMVEYKVYSIDQNDIEAYIDDQPAVAKGISKNAGIEVVLHRGDWNETRNDIFDIIREKGGVANPRSLVIISVPHATGLSRDSEVHGHDYIAEEIARYLAKQLNIPSSNLLIGDMPREVMDLNRERNRWKSQFRNKLRNLIKRDPENTILLDVHSFRPQSKVYAGNDIAIVTTERRPRAYETELREYLKEKGIEVKIYTEMLMDVVPEARELGVPIAYLLEFNEGLSKAKRRRYAKFVADFLKQRILANPEFPLDIDVPAYVGAKEVFAYGTLQTGGAFDATRFGNVLKRERATVKGQLRDTGQGFPAARFNVDGIVKGEVITIDMPSWRYMDELEGTDRGMYNRIPIKVTLEDGSKKTVQVYEWGDFYEKRNPFKKMPLVEDGDWLKHIAREDPLERISPDNIQVGDFIYSNIHGHDWYGIIVRKEGDPVIGPPPEYMFWAPWYHDKQSAFEVYMRYDEFPSSELGYIVGGGGHGAEWYLIGRGMDRLKRRMWLRGNPTRCYKCRLIIEEGEGWVYDTTSSTWSGERYYHRGCAPARLLKGNENPRPRVNYQELSPGDLVFDDIHEEFGVVVHVGPISDMGTRSSVWADWRDSEPEAEQAYLELESLDPLEIIDEIETTSGEWFPLARWVKRRYVDHPLRRPRHPSQILEQIESEAEAPGEVIRIPGAESPDEALALVTEAAERQGMEVEVTGRPDGGFHVTLRRPVPVAYDKVRVGDLVEPIGSGMYGVVVHIGHIGHRGTQSTAWAIWSDGGETEEEKIEFAKTRWDSEPPEMFKPREEGGLIFSFEGDFRIKRRGLIDPEKIPLLSLYKDHYRQYGIEVFDDDSAWLYHPTTEDKLEYIANEEAVYFTPGANDMIIVSTHPDVGLSYGDGWVVPVRINLGYLTIEECKEHRSDYTVSVNDDFNADDPLHVYEVGEPFNVRAVGLLKVENPDCILCNDLKTPQVYYEDQFIIICEDLNKKDSIMGMIKRHTRTPEQWEKDWLVRMLNWVAGDLFPNEFQIVETMRTEPTHWHIHAQGNPSDKKMPASSVRNQLTDFLKMMVKFKKQMKIPKEWKYNGMEDFVLSEGQWFTPRKMPKGVKRGEMQMCFENAMQLAWRGLGKYTYVEGYALLPGLPLPANHAWVIDEQGRAIDPTWPYNPKIAYFGIPFKDAFIAETLLEKRTYGIIDNWEQRWPLITGKAKDFKAKA